MPDNVLSASTISACRLFTKKGWTITTPKERQAFFTPPDSIMPTLALLCEHAHDYAKANGALPGSASTSSQDRHEAFYVVSRSLDISKGLSDRHSDALTGNPPRALDSRNAHLWVEVVDEVGRIPLAHGTKNVEVSLPSDFEPVPKVLTPLAADVKKHSGRIGGLLSIASGDVVSALHPSWDGVVSVWYRKVGEPHELSDELRDSGNSLRHLNGWSTLHPSDILALGGIASAIDIWFSAPDSERDVSFANDDAFSKWFRDRANRGDSHDSSEGVLDE